MRSILTTLTMALAFVACGDSVGPGRLDIRVEGVVTVSSTGLPIEGATITVSEIFSLPGAPPLAVVETDSEGNYSLGFRTSEDCEPEGQISSPFSTATTKPGFVAPVIVGFPECTEDLQRRDIEMQPQ